MKTTLRAIATFISAIAASYFVLFVGGIWLRSAGFPWMAGAVAGLSAIGVAAFVWKATLPSSSGLLTSTGLGALVTAGIALVVGFFGPMVFSPSANQGPLLGFIVGPIGLVLGALGGGVYWLVKVRRRKPDTT